MELFLRLIRCNNLPALRTLSEQFDHGPVQEPMKRMLAQMPVTTESELRWLFSQLSQQYEHLDLQLSLNDTHFDYILNRNLKHVLNIGSPVLENLARSLNLFSSPINTRIQLHEDNDENSAEGDEDDGDDEDDEDDNDGIGDGDGDKPPPHTLFAADTHPTQHRPPSPEPPAWLVGEETTGHRDADRGEELGLLLGSMDEWQDFQRELERV